MSHRFSVRAVDLGYGHVKFSEGRSDGAAVRFDSFPSQSPAAREGTISGTAIQQRDTFVVRVNERHYEVGKAVALASGANHESEVLDQDFSLSDTYAARLYGALSYMLPGLKARTLDYLVLGLPLTTYYAHAEAVAAKFSGVHTLNEHGDTLTIHKCFVFPQPLGTYVAFLHEHPTLIANRHPMALVVDPGYNTVDWFLCQKENAVESRSGATLRGVSAVLKAIAERICKSTRAGVTTSEVVRRLDESLTTSQPFTMFGKPFDLVPYMPAGASVVEEAAQAVKNAIGSGLDIDLIILTGGGAKLYTQAIAAKFPEHKIVTMGAPAFANTRGFHHMGERLAQSAARAAGNAA